MLYLASGAYIKYNRELSIYYSHKVSTNMYTKKALIKTTVKLASIMYSMLK